MISFNNNLSLMVQNQMARTAKAIQKSILRLSTGKRMNSPADDVAGFSVATGLDAQIRGLRQGIRNINEAQGLLSTAMSAMTTQIDLVTRMREIAVRASSGSLSADDRENLNTELRSLFEEFQSFTRETEFNGRKLLDGSFSPTELQLGFGSGDTAELAIGNLRASQIFEKTVGTGTFRAQATQSIFASGATTAPRLTDVNNDGNLDFIATTGGNFYLSLGNGKGQFSAATTFASVGGLRSFDFADLNNDGSLDLYYTTSGTTLGIRFGNGDGTFQSVVQLTFGMGTLANRSNLAADFDGDGNLDLASVDNTDSTISVVLGNGDGTFQSRQTLSILTNATNLVAGDVNRDGKLDLVVGHGGTVDVVNVHYGNGDGTFQTGVSYTMGDSASHTFLSDINGDGWLDLIDASSGDMAVSVRLNDGAGAFAARSTYSTQGNISNLRLADLNNDGVMDILYSFSGTPVIGVMIGNSNGTFQDPVAHTFGVSSQFLDVGDINNDGIVDFASISAAQNNVFSGIGIGIEKSAVPDMNVLSQENAQKLISILDTAMENILRERSALSAVHSRLDISSSANLLIGDYLEAAKDNIERSDVALEVADLVKNQILQQGQAAILAQANISMQLALQLLNVFSPDK